MFHFSNGYMIAKCRPTRTRVFLNFSRGAIAPVTALALIFAMTAAANALEKASTPCLLFRPPGGIDTETWSASTECTLAYYNVCTGWTWAWPLGGCDVFNRFGVQFDACADGCKLELSGVNTYIGSLPGYGFTGTIAVHAADANDCPTGPALASLSFLPSAGWNVQDWPSVDVPSSFVILVTTGGSPVGPDPAMYRTDNPASAAGACFPQNRLVHSHYYGTVGSPLCPGISFNDDNGQGDAELLFYAGLTCPVSVEQESWGRIKSLYR